MNNDNLYNIYSNCLELDSVNKLPILLKFRLLDKSFYEYLKLYDRHEYEVKLRTNKKLPQFLKISKNIKMCPWGLNEWIMHKDSIKEYITIADVKKLEVGQELDVVIFGKVMFTNRSSFFKKKYNNNKIYDAEDICQMSHGTLIYDGNMNWQFEWFDKS